MNPFDLYAGTFHDLVSTIKRNSVISGVSSINAFVEEFSVVASDSGDAPDLFPVEIFKEGHSGYQVNAYNFDVETGEITFAVADTEFSNELITFNRQHAEKYIKRALRFFNNCKKKSFVDELEESSDDWELAAHVHENIDFVKRVRILFFSPSVSSIQKPLEFEHADGVDFSRNIFDLVRYHNILGNFSTSEDYEIVLNDFGTESIPLLPASITDGYQSYMAVMPGELLAKIYSLFGGKLLEQNVRVFLQAKTKVNRGIIETIEKSPDHFFCI
ncbi:AIPR family protein [Rhodobacteraceae bacterium]|nr:AIPR family protein [Paracoccaceae bacterium]